MRAVWITGAGGPGALEVRETADPQPGPGQVRIRVQAAGLGFAEVMAARPPPDPAAAEYWQDRAHTLKPLATASRSDASRRAASATMAG